MSGPMQFDVVQIELARGSDASFDSFYIAGGTVHHSAQLIQEISQRAELCGTLKRVVYVDEDGDKCTLTAETLDDALHFIKPLGQCEHGSVGTLRVEAIFEASENVPTPEPSTPPSAEPPSGLHPCALEGSALFVLNSLAKGLDLRGVLPRLAGVALRLVESVDQPALYTIVEPLLNIQEGRLTAQDLPAVLPEFVAAVLQVPHSELPGLARRFHEEAFKELQAMRAEAKPANEQGDGVEVHPCVECDGCGAHPIVGARYKSLDQHNYDLCAECHSKKDGTEKFERKFGCVADVVGSFFAPAQCGPVHRNIICDGCEMTPLVGRRFNRAGDDYDLCGPCFDKLKQTDEASAQPFVEITIATATAVDTAGPATEVHVAVAAGKATSEAPKNTATQTLQRFAELAGETVCKDLLQSLLEQPSEAVRAAAAAALEGANGHMSADEAFQFRGQQSHYERVISQPLHLRRAEKEKVREEVAKEAENAALDETVELSQEPDETGRSTDVDTTSESSGVLVEFPEDSQSIPSPPSAKVVSSTPLFLGTEAHEEPSARGDVTEELNATQLGFQQAYRLARVFLPRSATGAMPAIAKAVVTNDGDEPWPESTMLACVLGDALGLPHLPLGSLGPGEFAELVLDLKVPASDASSAAQRSGWAVIDAQTGQPLGPLLVLELVRV